MVDVAAVGSLDVLALRFAASVRALVIRVRQSARISAFQAVRVRSSAAGSGGVAARTAVASRALWASKASGVVVASSWTTVSLTAQTTASSRSLARIWSSRDRCAADRWACLAVT